MSSYTILRHREVPRKLHYHVTAAPLAMMSEVASGVPVRRVPPVDVFNLPLYEHHLVIDVRSAAQYEQGRLVSAVSLPALSLPSSDEEREVQLVSFVSKLVRECSTPDNPSPVVVYGEPGEETDAHVQWLADRLGRLKKTALAVAEVEETPGTAQAGEEWEGESSYDPMAYFCQTIASRTAELWHIEGGYEAFKAKYSYLCGTMEFVDMSPIPHEITPNLYLGSRAMVYNKTELQKLGMTHFVGAASCSKQVHWEDMVGITTLSCEVKDTDNQRMEGCWEAVTEFISRAVAERPAEAKVLVFLCGRSRSASAIIAYLTRGLGYSLEHAWDHVHRVCRKVDRSLVYWDQLKAWSSNRRLQY